MLLKEKRTPGQARALVLHLRRLPSFQQILAGGPAQELEVVGGAPCHGVDSVGIKMRFIWCSFGAPVLHANVFIGLWRNERNMSKVFHKLN